MLGWASALQPRIFFFFFNFRACQHTSERADFNHPHQLQFIGPGSFILSEPSLIPSSSILNNSVQMPAPMFHHFRRLPVELRLLIWEFAVRPRGRGVHYFSIVDMRKHSDNPLRQLAVPDPADEDEVTYAVSAPMVPSSPGGCSWTTRNCSVYLWDAGLWTACRESRSVLEKRFQPCAWNAATYQRPVHTKPSRGSGAEAEGNTG